MADTPQSYEALVGLDFPPHQRAEPGEVRDDIPPESVPWLLARGAIRPAPAPKPKKPAKAEKE